MKKFPIYEDKFVLVTGGSEGIGLSIATDFVRSGAHVTICSRHAEKLERAMTVLHAVKKNSHQSLHSFSLDVTDAARTQSEIDRVVREQGVPDYVVNCAGLAHPGFLHELPLESFREMVEVNFMSLVHIARSIVPHLLAAKKPAHIVNTSSIAGFLGLFGYTGYSGTKYAVIGFSKALDHELKPFGIRVSVLCPPNTSTPGLARENLEKPAEVLEVEEKAKEISPDYVSQTLLKELAQKRFMIIPTAFGKLCFFVVRWFPSFMDLFIKRRKPRS